MAVLEQVDQDGVELYASMISFGRLDVMESIYPNSERVLGKQFAALVEDYLKKFPPDHFNFNRQCKRFSEYLTTCGGTLLDSHPYLAELADFEWLELEKMELDLKIEPAEAIELNDPAKLALYRPLVNPTLSIRKYKYDVLAITEKLENAKRLGKDSKPCPTNIAAFRHPVSHRCRFLALTEVGLAIIESAHQKQSNYQQLAGLSVSLFSDVAPQQAVLDFLDLVEELQDESVFVGSVRQAGIKA